MTWERFKRYFTSKPDEDYPTFNGERIRYTRMFDEGNISWQFYHSATGVLDALEAGEMSIDEANRIIIDAGELEGGVVAAEVYPPPHFVGVLDRIARNWEPRRRGANGELHPISDEHTFDPATRSHNPPGPTTPDDPRYGDRP